MTLTLHPDGAALICQVGGELNAITAPQLKHTLSEAVRSGRNKLVIDLSGVLFIDSSGLGALISGLKTAKQSGGNLVLAGLQEQARTIFEITMAYRIFDIFPSPVEAKAHLES